MSSQAASSRPATAPRTADGAAVGAGRLRALWSRSSVKVGALTVAAAFVYCLDSLNLLRRFLASTFDLVIFDQGVRGYAHLAAPVSIARGVSDGQGAHFLLLADHWSPVLALLAPLYWIHDSPATLLVTQGVLFALAIPPLWIYTRRQLGPGAAYFVCVAYALSLPVMEAVIFDFHEVAFVPVLTAVMVERFDAGKRWHVVLAAAALLLVKEDMGLLVAGFGGYLMLTRRRPWVWTGLAFAVGGVAATWAASHLLIPAFGGSATFYWAYGQFGSTLGGALLNVITHPLHALHVFVTPWVKARTMIGLLAMFGFLPLASPMVIAVLPLLAERMLASGYPLWWQAKFQYDAFLVMMLCCAAVDGAARLQRHWPERWNCLADLPVRPPGLAAAGRDPPGARPRSGPPRSAPRRWSTFRPRRSGRCSSPASTAPTRGCGRPRRPSRTCPPGSRWRRPTTSARRCPAGTPCCCSTARPGGRRGWWGTRSGSTSRSARPASRPRSWRTCARTGTRRCSPPMATWYCTARPTRAPRRPWPIPCPRPACTRTSATDGTGAVPARGQPRAARPPAAA